MTTIATTSTQSLPGYVAGTWDIDPVHSEVSFVVRHMVVSKVRGRFNEFTGTIVTAEDPLASSVEATIDAASIDTNQDQRDAHVRSADFLDVESHPSITFTSTALRANGDDWVLDGDLTIRGVTKPAVLEVTGLKPAIKDPWGLQRTAVSGTTKINRQDFGLTYSETLDNGGLVVGNEVEITLDVEMIVPPGK